MMISKMSFAVLPDLHMSAVGDWGCNSDTKSTLSNIQGKGPEQVLALGDYSYQSTAKCWLDIINPIKSKTHIAIGNHENDADEGNSAYMNAFGLSKQYYSFDYQYVHVLTMATEISFGSGSSQYNFVKSDLQTAAANPNIKWIIVNYHRAMYTSPSTCGASTCQGSPALRDAYQPLFDQYGVDLVLEGHIHDYQRTYPLKYNPSNPSSPIKTNSNLNDYTDPAGEIYAIVGTGGINFHGLSGKTSFTASQQDTKFGALDIKFINGGSKLDASFYSNGGSVMDHFSITKPSDTTPPTLVSTIPTSGATGVAATTTITAKFSEPIQTSTVTGTTFTLKNSAGTSITGTYSFPDSQTAVFTPSSSLAFSTSYTAAVTSGIKDLAGNGLTAASWSFTTAAPSDTTPPTLVSTIPTSGATGVAATTTITAKFSEPIQTSTVTGTTFTLKNSAGTSITGTYSFPDSQTAVFTPSSSLAFSTSYTAAVTSGIKDLAGNGLTAASWSFTTAAAPPSSCSNSLPVSNPASSGSQSTFGPANAFDNNISTKWWSTFIVNPWIQGDLGAQKSICSVGIAWTDGTSRQYSFTISTSADGTLFTNIFSGKSSGTTSAQEKYTFPDTSARFVRVTITQSSAGSASSIAQISEIDIFSSSSTTTSFSASTIEQQPTQSTTKSLPNQEPSSTIDSSNHRPLARDDKFITQQNTIIVANVLKNDVDSDSKDKPKIVSVSSPTKKGSLVSINKNGTITFVPAPGLIGLDKFTYTLSDSSGKTDNAVVSVQIIPKTQDNRSPGHSLTIPEPQKNNRLSEIPNLQGPSLGGFGNRTKN